MVSTRSRAWVNDLALSLTTVMPRVRGFRWRGGRAGEKVEGGLSHDVFRGMNNGGYELLQGYGCTTSGAIGVSPKISGAYIASTRAGGNSNVPTLFRRTVYSTLHWPCGT